MFLDQRLPQLLDKVRRKRAQHLMPLAAGNHPIADGGPHGDPVDPHPRRREEKHCQVPLWGCGQFLSPPQTAKSIPAPVAWQSATRGISNGAQSPQYPTERVEVSPSGCSISPLTTPTAQFAA